MHDEPEHYEVTLIDGDTRIYDTIRLRDNGWLGGWLETPTGRKHEQFPPNQVAEVKSEYDETESNTEATVLDQ